MTKRKALLFAVAVAALTLANVLARERISIGGLFYLSYGNLLIPLLLIIGDTIHEVYGYKSSRMVTHCATVGCLLLYGIMYAVGFQEFSLFGLRIVLGSMIAAECNDWVNDRTFVFIHSKLPNTMIARHVLSSAPALLVDAFIFQLLVWQIPILDMPVKNTMLQTMLTALVTMCIRCGFEVIFWPLTSRVIKYYSSKEN